MKIGYARVSTKEQNLDRPIDILERSGSNRIYKEKISGTKKDQPELNKRLDQFYAVIVIAPIEV